MDELIQLMQELLEEIRGLSSKADDILSELEDINLNSDDSLSELEDINRKSDDILSGIQDLKGNGTFNTISDVCDKLESLETTITLGSNY